MAFLPLSVLAQQSAVEDPLPDDLQSLLNTPVAVASIKEMTISESPAILTVISRDDMNRFGLKYLTDIANIIPGISFGCDVLGVVGIGIRNNWAHEGKALIMIDGIELNEDLYSNTQFGNHYSLDNIEKIEIIRGPGSVMYGGTAALMVINMISKKQRSAQTLNFNSVISFAGNQIAERGGSVSFSEGNQRSGFSLFSRYSRDIRSNKQYTDINGQTLEMAGLSSIENSAIHFSGIHHGWDLSVLYDDYILDSKDGYVDIAEPARTVRFESFDARLKKSITLNSRLEIVPFINYKCQAPWSVIYESKGEHTDEIVRLQKFSTGTHLSWSVNDYHSLAAGIEHWTESASSPDGAFPYFEKYDNHFSHQNYSAFIQSISKLRYWAFSPGARFNYSTKHLTSFVPRLAVTRIWNWGYSKAIASRSYRTPAIMNIMANEFIKPEFATVFEIETGVSFKAFSVLSFNLYRMVINSPITYYYDESTMEDKYINEGKAGTEGIELSFNHHFPSSKLILSSSISRPIKSNNHQLYKVEGQKNYVLGFSPYQFSVNYAYEINRKTSAWSSLSITGKKYGITSLDDLNRPVFSAYKETCLLNFGIKRLLDRAARWSLSASVNNLFNQTFYYIQPYRSYHGALPGKGREYSLILNYQFK